MDQRELLKSFENTPPHLFVAPDVLCDLLQGRRLENSSRTQIVCWSFFRHVWGI